MSLPAKWPDISAVDLDREHQAEFNCPCSRAGRNIHGNTCFGVKIAGVGKLLSESPPEHKPSPSVLCPLPFLRERLLESNLYFHHFQSGMHWELICGKHLKIPCVLEHTCGRTLLLEAGHR